MRHRLAPRYVTHFGGLVRAFGQRYDGHPDVDRVDMALVGVWGEGERSERLTQTMRQALADGYLGTFAHRPLVMLLTDAGGKRRPCR